MKKFNNGEFNLQNLNQEVELYGWVLKKRNLGGLIFIDLRDRSGIIQLVAKPESDFYDLASSLKNESVIKVKGIICERESKNLKIPTGEIEVFADMTITDVARGKSAETRYYLTSGSIKFDGKYINRKREKIMENTEDLTFDARVFKKSIIAQERAQQLVELFSRPTAVKKECAVFLKFC